jgi:hypothetical protein
VRILYAVHGYGRGHATRTLAILPELARRHTLLCLAGGDAYTAIWPDFPVVRIPTLRFVYARGTGRVSNSLTSSPQPSGSARPGLPWPRLRDGSGHRP